MIRIDNWQNPEAVKYVLYMWPKYMIYILIPRPGKL